MELTVYALFFTYSIIKIHVICKLKVITCQFWSRETFLVVWKGTWCRNRIRWWVCTDFWNKTLGAQTNGIVGDSRTAKCLASCSIGATHVYTIYYIIFYVLIPCNILLRRDYILLFMSVLLSNRSAVLCNMLIIIFLITRVCQWRFIDVIVLEYNVLIYLNIMNIWI